MNTMSSIKDSRWPESSFEYCVIIQDVPIFEDSVFYSKTMTYDTQRNIKMS
jgi:hypothetical protein